MRNQFRVLHEHYKTVTNTVRELEPTGEHVFASMRLYTVPKEDAIGTGKNERNAMHDYLTDFGRKKLEVNLVTHKKVEEIKEALKADGIHQVEILPGLLRDFTPNDDLPIDRFHFDLQKTLPGVTISCNGDVKGSEFWLKFNKSTDANKIRIALQKQKISAQPGFDKERLIVNMNERQFKTAWTVLQEHLPLQ